MITLKTSPRIASANKDVLRKEGTLPAVFYGPKVENTVIAVPTREFIKVWKVAGESSVIALVDPKGETHDALIHDVDVHPVTGDPRHVDFYIIEKGKKVEVAVPLNFVGVSAAVKDLGGILVKVVHDLKIKAAAKDLPHSIDLDISVLTTLDSVIHAKDIKLPSGVELDIDPEEVIASIAVAKEEVEEAPTAIDMSAIEVEKKGKEVAPGEEGAALEGDKK